MLKWLQKLIQRARKEALSIITIILLVVYVFISYRTYVIQQTRLEIDRTTYQLTLHLEENLELHQENLELQQKNLESLKNQNQIMESLVETLGHLYNQLAH